MFLAEAAATDTSPYASQGWVTIVMLLVMLAVFYFFLYRPQKKQEQQINEMRNSLEVGDEITTIGGIIGKVVSIKGDTVLIETGNDRNKIRILRSAVKSIDVRASEIEEEERAKAKKAKESKDTNKDAKGSKEKSEPADGEAKDNAGENK
ncbi:MAG TPA: preprotein translocase subunit YajC [Clostridiales bacterium]|nr:preprotein translocase subunit YajC [Clostridiales bacterium]